MARQQNELSAIQQDSALYAGIKAEIRRFTPDYLSTLGNVSRTTIFKYKRGEAINPGHESEILKAIKKAEDNKKLNDSAKVEEARSLIFAD